MTVLQILLIKFDWDTGQNQLTDLVHSTNLAKYRKQNYSRKHDKSTPLDESNDLVQFLLPTLGTNRRNLTHGIVGKYAKDNETYGGLAFHPGKVYI